MTLAITSDPSAAMLDGFADFVATGAGVATLTIYQTNIALCVFELDATPFDPAVGPSVVVGGAPISSTGTAVAGNANRLVLRSADDEIAMTATISALGGGGEIETPAVAITASSVQTLNALVFTLASDGRLGIVGSFTFV